MPPFAGARVFAAFDTTRVASVSNAATAFAPVHKHPDDLLVEDQPWEPRIDNGYPNVHYSLHRHCGRICRHTFPHPPHPSCPGYLRPGRDSALQAVVRLLHRSGVARRVPRLRH